MCLVTKAKLACIDWSWIHILCWIVLFLEPGDPDINCKILEKKVKKHELFVYERNPMQVCLRIDFQVSEKSGVLWKKWNISLTINKNYIFIKSYVYLFVASKLNRLVSVHESCQCLSLYQQRREYYSTIKMLHPQNR